MQKSQLFQQMLRKKQIVRQLLGSKATSKSTEEYKHFSGVSESTQLKIENNKLYLLHLNNQFRQQLRSFVHQQQSFNQTTFQLSNLINQLENQHQIITTRNDTLNQQLEELQIQNQLYQNKNQKLLAKIVLYQQQNKNAIIRISQYQKSAQILQQDIQYQNIVINQINKRNHQLIQQLQLKSAQVQISTDKLGAIQNQQRQKQIKLKLTNQQINQIYYTLDNQDNQLADLCQNIQNTLVSQNNLIHDVEYCKDRLELTIKNIQQKKAILHEQQIIQQGLYDQKQDLQYDLKRTQMQFQVQQKGIQQQYWKIETERTRVFQNRQYLQGLIQYISTLLQKNSELEKSLQAQIIQDYTMKKIIDSKMEQPYGKKVKKMLDGSINKDFNNNNGNKVDYDHIKTEYNNTKTFYSNNKMERQKQMQQTCSSFKQRQKLNSFSRISYKQRSLSPQTVMKRDLFQPIASNFNISSIQMKQSKDNKDIIRQRRLSRQKQNSQFIYKSQFRQIYGV